MLGISWFWFYGATFLAQFPGFARDFLGGDERVVTFLLALFSVGIGTGSLLCERLSGRKVEIGLVPFGSIGLTLFAIDLWFATRDLHADGPRGARRSSCAKPAHWRVTVDLVLIGVFGGFYIVPLYALIQARSGAIAPLADHRREQHPERAVHGRLGAGSPSRCCGAGLSIADLFLVTARHQRRRRAVHLHAGARVPDAVPRVAAHPLGLSRRQGRARQHPGGGAAACMVCNHVSYVDAVVIAACVRRPVRFVMDHRIFATPLLGFMFRTMRAIPIASATEDAALKERAFAQVREALRATARSSASFPRAAHDRLARSRAFRPGIERIVAETPVPVVPLALRGLVGKLLLARSRKGRAMRTLARHVLAHRARRRAAGAAGARRQRERCTRTVLALRGDAPLDARQRKARAQKWRSGSAMGIIVGALVLGGMLGGHFAAAFLGPRAQASGC